MHGATEVFMPSRVIRRALCAPIVVVAFAAFAQPVSPPKAAVVEPVFVTATRTAQPIIDLLADVTSIGQDEIARSGAQSLAELLQRQPGVEIVQNGGPGATSGVFLRGANTAQTLVLIDGMRVSSSTSGATALEAIPLSEIDHIEILRGPASSLYGADAIGGVIQVFTRSGSRGFGASASAGYGTYETSSLSAAVSGGNDRARFAVSAGARHSDGFNAIVNPANFSYDPDRDGYRGASVSANGSVTFAPEQEASAQYFRSRLDNQYDGGDSFDDRTITTLESWQVASRNRLASFWVSRLSAGEGSDDSVSKTGFGDFPFRTRQRQYAWQNDLTLPIGDLTLAYERREERVNGDSGFAVTSRNTDSGTAVYRFRYDAHALQANLRVDDSSQFGTRTTGALAYGYRISPAWRLTISGGTAFKPPTFNDLYFPGFSNPDLEPEKSRNVEGGVYWNAASGELRWETRAIAWYNRVRDLIVFECDANFNCAPQNVADATLKGVTLGADANWRDTRVTASLDLQSPTDDATGHLLPRRARSHGVVSVRQQAGPLTLGAEMVASSQRYDDAENTRRMGGYAIFNLIAEWPLSHGVTLFARADNVFDKNYELAADFSTGGARFFGGVRWRL
jgi:vitamin B12 transporter